MTAELMVRILERKKIIDPRLMNTAPQTVRLAERERLRSIAGGQDVYLLSMLRRNDEVVVDMEDVNAVSSVK